MRINYIRFGILQIDKSKKGCGRRKKRSQSVVRRGHFLSFGVDFRLSARTASSEARGFADGIDREWEWPRMLTERVADEPSSAKSAVAEPAEPVMEMRMSCDGAVGAWDAGMPWASQDVRSLRNKLYVKPVTCDVVMAARVPRQLDETISLSAAAAGMNRQLPRTIRGMWFL